MYGFVESPLFSKLVYDYLTDWRWKMPLSEKELARRDAKRNIGEELLDAVRDIKAGRTGRRFTAESYPVVRAREKSGLTQAEFARLLGVSVRTLQDWEQGRRAPTGAARSLLLIAEKRPNVLRQILRELPEAAGCLMTAKGRRQSLRGGDERDVASRRARRVGRR